MNKSDVIAKCLVKCNQAANETVAEAMVLNAFAQACPGQSFSEWNSAVSVSQAEDLINGLDTGSNVNLRGLLRDFDIN